MVAAVSMGKGVEGVVAIHSEGFGGDEHRAGGSKADVAAALPYHPGAHRSGGVVACTGTDLDGFGNTQQLCDFRLHGANAVVAFK